MSRSRSVLCLGIWFCFVVGSRSHADEPSFSREIVPVLYKLGCSAGQCHGSFQGKGNFRLSLFAADPEADHRELHGNFGRRVDRVSPESSLLLRKPTGQMPHGGGLRLKVGSPEYQLILRWIETGARSDAEAARVLSVRIEPATVVVPLVVPPSGGAPAKAGTTNGVPLRVLAKFNDGSERDVTRFARFEPLDNSIADADADGRVTGKRLGDTHVLAHYAGKIGVAAALVPGELSAGMTFLDEPLTDSIDRLVVEKLKRLNIVPSGLCNDSDFLRRVTLDVAGRLPTVEEAKSFLSDSSSDKRVKTIDRLLTDPLHAAVWATKMCDALGADNRTMYDQSVYRIHDWFRNRFERNVPWTEMVRGALTGTIADGRNEVELEELNRQIAERRKKEQDAEKEKKKLEPEPLADKPWRVGPAIRNTLEDFSYNLKFRVQAGPRKGRMDPRPLTQHVATAFLGVRLECAECHKHPHDRWSQQDFFGFTTAFAFLDRGLSPEMRAKKLNFINGVYITDKPQEEFPDPVTGEPLSPRVLGGAVIDVQPGTDPRLEVWKWMVSPENPYFVKAIVNRVWGHYFGRGLIDPVDALSEANPPSHPEVLDELCRDFVAHGYDLRQLHRRILNTRTYQREYGTNATNATDERNYSHRVLRRMSAELILDAIADVTGTPLKIDVAVYGGPGDSRTVERAIEMPLSRPRGDDTYVLRIFDKPQRTQSCDCERSSNPNLSQALYFYNDADLTAKITNPTGRLTKLLTEIADDNKLLDELYLLTLTRLPTDAERERSVAHVKLSKSRAEGFEDLMWSLLNRQEFVVTH